MVNDSKDKEEFDEVNKKYKDILNRVNNEEYTDNLSKKERLKIFFDLYNRNLLTKYTRYLYFATLLLALVAVLQLIKELKGTETTLNFINGLLNLGVILFAIFFIFQILGAIIDYIKKDWNEFLKENTSKLRKLFLFLRILFVIILVIYILLSVYTNYSIS